eukprot:CAMPEP_0172507414 /NCGR_PEP_ID=MMETSP1066-20121228/203514_1 /TAXON_ID=671091 /ORGANISM="Coscinodiscus wailesii, Strain CCMP2513" /LENGTH=154 /DNA_ID=CAMNT_0013284963 /DNA_START=153 /DNA_END=617 /DNA_ORIENTATION=+
MAFDAVLSGEYSGKFGNDRSSYDITTHFHLTNVQRDRVCEISGTGCIGSRGFEITEGYVNSLGDAFWVINGRPYDTEYCKPCVMGFVHCGSGTSDTNLEEYKNILVVIRGKFYHKNRTFVGEYVDSKGKRFPIGLKKSKESAESEFLLSQDQFV